MVIKSADFVTSIADVAKYSELICGIDEVAVFGRSNVGKSSFINMLCNNSKLAKTSQTPGRTRLVNIFSINKDAFWLVDLPGYGFAQGSKQQQEQWSRLIEDYLGITNSLKCAIFLLDIRREPSELDFVMLEYLYRRQIPFLTVLTKADKLSRLQINNRIMAVSSALSLGKADVFAVSNLKKTGREQVLCALANVLGIE